MNANELTLSYLNLIPTATTAASAEILDVFEDLAEINYMLEELKEFPVDFDKQQNADTCQFSQAWFQANFRRSIDLLKKRHEKNLNAVERARLWATSADRAQILNLVRQDFLALKSALRIAYRQKGAALCAADWQSPVYASSLAHGLNRLTDGIAEHSWDYKRDGHLDSLAYEANFLQEYASNLQSENLDAYLTNSGMAGFSTIIHCLADEIHLAGNAMAITPMYFENIHLAKAFFPQIYQLQPQSSAHLLAELRQQKPSLVLVDAVTNCNDVISHDIDTILEWACRENTAAISIVIDTTCFPLFLLPKGWLKNVPNHVSIILVESLAKYHQFGMDTVTGGIVLIHGQTQLRDTFKKTRARLGTNIADTTVGSLPRPSLEILAQRLRRHSRNTRLLIEQIEQDIPKQNGVIESISWLRHGPELSRWFTSSCFTLHLRPDCRSIQRYREFEHRVVALAQEAQLPVALGTSFGFDVSRFYVTAPATRFEDPFLRVSVGTETNSQIMALARIIQKANAELAAVWQQQPVPAKMQPVNKELPISIRESRNAALSSGNVFLGKSALQDYLCPANFPATPLVELPEDLNPFSKDGVRIFAKIMPLVPLMNIKSIPSYSMLAKAFEKGKLNGVENIIESSSSNTVLSLSVIGRLFGIENTKALVDHSIAPGLVRMLRLFGIDVMLHPGPGHEMYANVEPRSERAHVQGSQPGWINPGQYGNPDNPEGFAKWLAPDLWAQTNGRLGLLACALGTCGTLVGVANGLREFNPDLTIIAACPAAGQAVPGPREHAQLKDVQFAWQNVAQSRLEMGAVESFAASVKLLRRGIMGGPSSGMNYAALLNYLDEARRSGQLKQMLNANGELWSAFLCCDSPLPHVDEYYDALGDDFFPAVQPVADYLAAKA